MNHDVLLAKKNKFQFPIILPVQVIPFKQQQNQLDQFMDWIDELKAGIFLIVIVYFIIQKIEQEEWKQQQQMAQINTSDRTMDRA